MSTDLNPYVVALAGLTRRPTEKLANGSVRGWLTHARCLDITSEADGAVSAFGVADIEIAGRMTSMIVYLGDIYSGPTETAKMVTRAKVIIAEVVSKGSGAAKFHGEGLTSNGVRAFIYSAPSLHLPLAEARVEAFVARNRITTGGVAKTVAAKPSKSSKKVA